MFQKEGKIMDLKNDNKYIHRMGTKTLKISNSDKTALVNKEVVIKQVKHKFLFGCSEFSTVPYVNGEFIGEEKEIAEKRFEKMFQIFNSVTLPFYWGRFEPLKGKPDTNRVKKAAEWLNSRNVTIKGHPLCWHTSTAPWLLEMTNQEILSTQLERINRDVSGFAGLINMWDVINEVVIMPIFDKYDNGITKICKDLGRIRLVKEVFTEAKKANPKATLLINDFNTSVAYDILIEGLLEAGVPIDVIGIQSHMHQGYWGAEKTHEILERFSRFNLPLHFTENTLVSGKIMPPEIDDLNDYKLDDWPSTPEGEERQAREAVLHYRTLFEHPLVESITWWSFNDGLWLKAPSGLITKDSKAKPAYNELYQLIKGEWWSGEQHTVTDSNGMITVSGYLGDYIATCEGTNINFSI